MTWHRMVLRRAADPTGRFIWFRRNDLLDTNILRLDRDAWIEMERPDVITVTVEPGRIEHG